MIEIIARWGGTAIAVDRIDDNANYSLTSFGYDHILVDNGRVRVGERMALAIDGKRVDVAEIALGSARATVRVGPIVFTIRRSRRRPLAIDRLRDVIDARLLKLSGFALALHAGFVALLLLTRSFAPATDDIATFAPRFTTTIAKLPPRVRVRAVHEEKAPSSSPSPTKVASRPSTRSTKRSTSRELAAAALRALGLGAGAASSVFGADGPQLGNLRGTTVASVGAAGFGTRDTGGGGGGDGVNIGGLFAGVRPGAPGDGIDLGRGKKTTTVVVDRHVIVDDGLHRDEIQRVVSRAMAQIKYCYEKELNGHADLDGKLVISWLIAQDGSVATTSILQNTLVDGAVGDCVSRVIARLKFPSPRGGGTVAVTYPFVFSTSGSE
jgi:hypothetical protein